MEFDRRWIPRIATKPYHYSISKKSKAPDSVVKNAIVSASETP